MNEPHAPAPAGGEPPKKPVIELLDDIRTQAGFPRRKPRHFVNPKLMNSIVFGVSLASLLFCVVVMLLMIWGGMKADMGLKYIASIGVVLLATFAINAMNENLTE